MWEKVLTRLNDLPNFMYERNNRADIGTPCFAETPRLIHNTAKERANHRKNVERTPALTTLRNEIHLPQLSIINKI